MRAITKYAEWAEAQGIVISAPGTGWSSVERHLANPRAVCAIAQYVFVDVKFEGELPGPEGGVPEGAIP